MKRLSGKIASHERKLQALELRKAGASYQAIAEQLGYSGASGAFAAVKAALRDTLREPAQELRDLELTRLDAALLALWRRVQDGDEKAIDRMLAIMKRRSELLGLDRKPRPEPEQGGPAIVGRQNLGAAEIATTMDAVLQRYQGGRIDAEQARQELAILSGQLKAAELVVLAEKLDRIEAALERRPR
jgi:transposase-like protein